MRTSRPPGFRIVLAAALISASMLVPGVGSAAEGQSNAPRLAQARVVLAVVESSVNVYHQEFREPRQTEHPAAHLAGFPRSARPLDLDLREPDLETAISNDDSTWRGIEPGRLYYVPGTRFAGIVHLPAAVDTYVSSEDLLNPRTRRPVIDGFRYHGTGVASVAAGRTLGTCPLCDIVVVAAQDPEVGLAWAAAQPWIDIISNSWGAPGNAPTRASVNHPERAAELSPEPSRRAAEAGQAVVFASGNGVTTIGPDTGGTQHGLTWKSPYAGPGWVFTVGAAKAVTGQPTDWHNIPVDVIAQGEDRPAASDSSITQKRTFEGTSCSAPVAAGVLAEALRRARQALRIPRSGVSDGALLRGPKRPGPLADGVLTYLELFTAAQSVAKWQPFDPTQPGPDPFFTPTTAGSFAYQGHGLLDRQSIGPLADVLAGRRSQPARPEMHNWTQYDDAARRAAWGPEPRPASTS